MTKIYDGTSRADVLDMARTEDGLKVPYVRCLLALNDDYEYALKMLHRIAYSGGGSFETVDFLRKIALDTLSALAPPSEAREQPKADSERSGNA